MSEDIMYGIKIKVADIDKTALYEGQNGKYLDLVMIPTPNNKYGSTHMVVQSLPKERRDQGERGPILGNAKVLGGGRSGGSQPPSSPGGKATTPPSAFPNAPEPSDIPEDDIPF